MLENFELEMVEGDVDLDELAKKVVLQEVLRQAALIREIPGLWPIHGEIRPVKQTPDQIEVHVKLMVAIDHGAERPTYH